MRGPSLPYQVDNCLGPVYLCLPEELKGQPTLEKCKEKKLVESSPPHPPHRSSTARTPCLSVVYFSSMWEVVFLKIGGVILDALPPTLWVGVVVHRAYFVVEGEIGFPTCQKSSGSGGRDSMSSASSTTIHWSPWVPLVTPGPQFSHLYKVMLKSLPVLAGSGSFSTPQNRVIQSNFLGIQEPLEVEDALD